MFANVFRSDTHACTLTHYHYTHTMTPHEHLWMFANVFRSDTHAYTHTHTQTYTSHTHAYTHTYTQVYAQRNTYMLSNTYRRASHMHSTCVHTHSISLPHIFSLPHVHAYTHTRTRTHIYS